MSRDKQNVDVMKATLILGQSPRVSFRQAFSSPVSLFFVSIVYAAALAYCLAAYAAVEWAEYGFSFGKVSLLDALVLYVVLVVWAAVLPRRIHRPSSLFLIVIYLFVCVPAAVAMVGLQAPNDSFYYPLLISLGFGFTVACLVVRNFSWRGGPRKDVTQLLPFLVIAWVACLAVLLASFGSIMSFSGLDNIYEQRSQGKATNLFEGYAQTYFGYVFSPALLAFGLVRKNYLLVIAGITGSVVLYMVTAEKAVFMYPIFMISLYLVIRFNASLFLTPSFIALSFSVSLFFATLFYRDSAIASFVAWYLGIRSLLVPGVFLIHYSNYFGDYGYTFGTHIKGVNLLIDAPMNFSLQPQWPSIGHFVGEDYLGIPTLNATANFIAWDGVATFGLYGVFVVLLLFAIFLVALDKCSRGIDNMLALPLLLPLALTLTNGSLFTGLTSFGGLFWILCLAFLFRLQGVGGTTMLKKIW